MTSASIDRIRRFAGGGFFSTGAALLLLGAVAGAQTASPSASQHASAQATAATRWSAFLGCWRATPPGYADPAPNAPLVCVSPTNDPAAVQVATIDKGVVVSRDTIDASGQHRALDKQGCAGWQSADWSADSYRVFLYSDVTCTGNVKRVGSGVFAIAPSGEWLDVQGMKAGSNAGVRVMHYRQVSTEKETLPAGIVDVAVGRDLATNAARTAAAGPLDVADVAEAVQHVDTAVTQAWIVERGAHFNLSAKDLVALANAGVPGSVTDVMVGLSYPEHFALRQSPMGLMAGGPMSARDSARVVSEYQRDHCSALDDPYWGSPTSYGACGYGYSAYGRGLYGYGYGSYYGYGYGYSPYGLYGAYGPAYYGGLGGGFYSAPVIVVKGDQGQQDHGRVVNGRGYTHGSSGSASSGASTTRSDGGYGSSSSSSGSSSSSSGSSGGGGRTAHATKPPV